MALLDYSGISLFNKDPKTVAGSNSENNKKFYENKDFQKYAGLTAGAILIGGVALLAAPVAVPTIATVGLGFGLGYTAITFGVVALSAVAGATVGYFTGENIVPQVGKFFEGFFPGNNQGGKEEEVNSNNSNTSNSAPGPAGRPDVPNPAPASPKPGPAGGLYPDPAGRPGVPNSVHARPGPAGGPGPSAFYATGGNGSARPGPAGGTGVPGPVHAGDRRTARFDPAGGTGVPNPAHARPVNARPGPAGPARSGIRAFPHPDPRNQSDSVTRGIERVDAMAEDEWRENQLLMPGADAGSRDGPVVASSAPTPAFLKIPSYDNARASNQPPANPASRAESSNQAPISPTVNLPKEDRSHKRVEEALSFENLWGSGRRR